MRIWFSLTAVEVSKSSGFKISWKLVGITWFVYFYMEVSRVSIYSPYSIV